MARVKYYNPESGKWEYADSSFVVGNGTDSGGNVDLPEVTAEDAGKFLRVSSAGVWVAELLTDVSEVGA